MVTLLYTGAAALVVALVTILTYEWHAWRTGKEPTISTEVRLWDHKTVWGRRTFVFTAITIIAWSIQFLAIHFVFNVG